LTAMERRGRQPWRGEVDNPDNDGEESLTPMERRAQRRWRGEVDANGEEWSTAMERRA